MTRPILRRAPLGALAALLAASLGLGAAAQSTTPGGPAGNTSTGVGASGTGSSPVGADSRGNAAGNTGTPPSTGRSSSGMGTDGAGAGGSASTSADARFVQQAAQDGMAEVALGKLAQTQAASDRVKEFGRQMEQDHSQANDQLKQIAGGKGLTPPAALDAAHQRRVDQLAKLSGAPFDQAYVQAMVQDHRKAVALFQREARSGKDAELKGFAGATLPKLQEHLRMARDLQRTVRAANGRDDVPGSSRGEAGQGAAR